MGKKAGSGPACMNRKPHAGPPLEPEGKNERRLAAPLMLSAVREFYFETMVVAGWDWSPVSHFSMLAVTVIVRPFSEYL